MKTALFLAKLGVLSSLLIPPGLAFSYPPATAGNSFGVLECPDLITAPLTYGMKGYDVQNLQAFLIGEGIEIPAGATGYYGNQTREAVNAFQIKYAFQILYPLHLTHPTGSVYRATIAQINAIYCTGW